MRIPSDFNWKKVGAVRIHDPASNLFVINDISHCARHWDVQNTLNLTFGTKDGFVLFKFKHSRDLLEDNREASVYMYIPARQGMLIWISKDRGHREESTRARRFSCIYMKERAPRHVEVTQLCRPTLKFLRRPSYRSIHHRFRRACWQSSYRSSVTLEKNCSYVQFAWKAPQEF